jgi:hypothetical protein
MENNELEEMRAQLDVLNKKLEGEAIVSETMLSNATKKSVSKMQRRLLIRIIVAIVLSPLVFTFGGLWILIWCLGVIALNLYVYQKTKKIYAEPLDVADFTSQTHKIIKTYKRTRKILFIFFSASFLALGIFLLLVTGFSAQAFSRFFFILVFAIFSSVIYFVVEEVFVKPDVELTLEQVLHDLEVQPNFFPGGNT